MRRPTVTQVLLWGPLLFAAADLLLMLANGPELIRALHHNADVAAAQMVAALYGQHGHGSLTVLGYPWYEGFWFTRATAWLPGARGIWTIAPFVFSGAGVGALGWTAWRLFGAWAGAMTAAILVCTSTATRIVLFTLDWHGGAIVHAVFLCVVLVLVIRYTDRLSNLGLAGIAVAVAAVTALTVPDQLSYATAIGPFAGTALILWWRTGLPRERRVAISALASMAVAVTGGEAVAHTMSNAGVIVNPDLTVCFTDYHQLTDNLEILVAAFTALGGGTFFLRGLDAAGLGRFALAVLTVGAAVLVVRRLWGLGPRLVAPARVGGREAVAREAYVVFWSLALVAVLGAFVITDVSWDVISSRYLTGGFVAVAALVPPLLGASGRARLVTAGAIGAFTALTFGLHVHDGIGSWSEGSDLSGPTHQLEAFARARGLEVGYGGYKDAPVVSWLADERVKVFPVSACGARLCPFGVHTISSWYRPRRGVRTFLVTHPGAPGLSLSGPYARAGRPLEARRFGPLVVYVYGHDLAANLGPSRGRRSATLPCGIANRLHRPAF
ncbi:MAG: hypothetical protein JOZ25_00885 [Actinobacteria bacterium]|nr:hypothetical protein [Actinomycetota bacterium]